MTILLKLADPLQSWGRVLTLGLAQPTAILPKVLYGDLGCGFSYTRETRTTQFNQLDFAYRLINLGKLLSDYHVAGGLEQTGR